MNKTEKQFKEYMNSKIHVKDTFAKISKRIDFNEKEEKNFMAKNKFLPVLCCFAAVGVVAVGVVTKGFGLLEKEAKSMVTIDVNPSVELVLDENDKVLSVRGANDDGKLVIYGERIVGQDVEKAVEIIIQSEIDTGYIVANAQIGANQYSVTINSDTQLISDELLNKINSVVESTCDANNIAIVADKCKALARAELEALAVKIDPTITAEEAAAMETSQLLAVVKLYHLETATLYTEQLEDLYTSVKEHKFQFMEKESTKEALDSVNSLIVGAVKTAYSVAVEGLKTAQENIEALRYEWLVKEDSAYQNHVSSLKDKKQEVLALKNEVATLEDGADKNAKEQALNLALTAFTKAEENVAKAYEQANAAFDYVSKTIDNLIEELDELLERFLDLYSRVQAKVEAKLVEAEAKLNKTKDKIFADFEEKYAGSIKSYKNQLAERKAAMEEAIKGNN